jgi:hypothetical protein
MASKRAQTITLSEVEKAVATALQQLQHHQKTAHASQLASSRLIMGKWIRDLNLPQAEADAAAKEITRQVDVHVGGLNAEPFAVAGHGGTTMGFMLREE